MAKRAVEVPPWVSLDPSSGAPYYRQLYDGMRRAILSGLLSSGTRLPSTRTLATELGVSRTTVVTAFEGLLAEGYLEGKVGSGTFVANSLPDDSLSVAFEASREPGSARSGRGLSGRERCWRRHQRPPWGTGARRAPSGRECQLWTSSPTLCGAGS